MASPDLKIQILGASASGKTQAAIVVAEVLRSYGYEVDIKDPDHKRVLLPHPNFGKNKTCSIETHQISRHLKG